MQWLIDPQDKIQPASRERQLPGQSRSGPPTAVRSTDAAGRLGSAFRRIRKRAGLPKDLVVYLTRHEHGTRVCELHGIQAAADALGHSDVKTTSTRYVKKNRRLQRDRQEGLFDDDLRPAA